MTEMLVPIHEKVYGDVIDPPIPERPKDRRRLLYRCLGAKAYGYAVVGLTPRHLGSEGMWMLRRQAVLSEHPEPTDTEPIIDL